MRIDYKSLFLHKSPEPKHQFPLGMKVFTALQGHGKSLSLVNDAFAVKQSFPECVVFSNMTLYGIRYKFYRTVSDLIEVLKFKNGSKGVLIIIDEAQNYFNKKTGVPIEVMSQLCQNRKNRRHILMTSQIWEDLDVPVRKQVHTVVKCRRFFNLQINTYYNGEQLHWDNRENAYVAPKRFTKIFKHNDDYYSRYETLEIIETNDELDKSLTMGQGAPPAPVRLNINYKKR